MNPILKPEPITVDTKTTRAWLKKNGHETATVDAKPMTNVMVRKRSVLELHGVSEDEYTRAGGTV